MTGLTPQQYVHRLNMCLEAGLDVIFSWRDVPEVHWMKVSDTAVIYDYDLKEHDFLVLRPGETVDNFIIED